MSLEDEVFKCQYYDHFDPEGPVYCNSEDVTFFSFKDHNNNVYWRYGCREHRLWVLQNNQRAWFGEETTKELYIVGQIMES